MGGALTDEGHAAVLASFIQARYSLVVWIEPPALGAEAGSAVAHATATLPTSTAALPRSTAESSPTVSSLPFHLYLPVGRFPPERSVFVTVSAIVEAVVVTQLAAEGERAVKIRAHHGFGIVTVRSEHHIDALSDENVRRSRTHATG